jgi:hypothetical protein
MTSGTLQTADAAYVRQNQTASSQSGYTGATRGCRYAAIRLSRAWCSSHVVTRDSILTAQLFGGPQAYTANELGGATRRLQLYGRRRCCEAQQCNAGTGSERHAPHQYPKQEAEPGTRGATALMTDSALPIHHSGPLSFDKPWRRHNCCTGAPMCSSPARPYNTSSPNMVICTLHHLAIQAGGGHAEAPADYHSSLPSSCQSLCRLHERRVNVPRGTCHAAGSLRPNLQESLMFAPWQTLSLRARSSRLLYTMLPRGSKLASCTTTPATPNTTF